MDDATNQKNQGPPANSHKEMGEPKRRAKRTTPVMSKRITLVTWLLILVVPIVFVPWLAYQTYLASFDSKRPFVEKEIERMRQAGLPVDNESLDTWYQERTDPTDARAWMEIGQFVASSDFVTLAQGVPQFDPKTPEESEWTEQGWPAEDAARRLLNDTTDERETIRTLSRKRIPVRYPIQFNSFQTTLAHMQLLRGIARLLDVECDVAIADRDSVRLTTAVKTYFDMVEVHRHESFVVSQLVCSAIRRMAYAAIRKGIEQGFLDDSAIESLSKLLTEESLAIDSLQETLQSEMAGALPMFMNLDEYLLDDMGNGSNGFRPSIVTGSRRARYNDIAHYIEHIQGIANTDTKSLDDAILKAEQLEQQLGRNIREAGTLGSPGWIVTGVAAPAIAAIVSSFAEEKVQRNFLMHGLAIRRYQRKANEQEHGAFPDSLEALSQIGFDSNDWPTVGPKPFGYRIEDETAILWYTPNRVGRETQADPPSVDGSTPYADQLSGAVMRLKK